MTLELTTFSQCPCHNYNTRLHRRIGFSYVRMTFCVTITVVTSVTVIRVELVSASTIHIHLKVKCYDYAIEKLKNLNYFILSTISDTTEGD